MKIRKLLGNRILWMGALILVQLIWITVMLFKLVNYDTMVDITLRILSILIVLYIVRKDENPAYKISWVLLIGMVPLFGGLLYVLMGNKRPSRHLARKIGEQEEHAQAFLAQDPEVMECLAAESPRVKGTATYIEKTAHFPVWQQSRISYYKIGEELFEAMLLELEKAEHFIFLEYFIVADGKMWQALLHVLKRKVAQGLDVRMIYDDFGSLTTLPSGYAQELESYGIKAFAFNPFKPIASLAMNNRNHRKILVIDNQVAFTGGINLADEYINEIVRFGHWKDTGVKVEGEAVWNFTVMFLTMWNAFRPIDTNFSHFRRPSERQLEAEESFIQPFSDSPLDSHTISENVYIEIITQATEYVYIMTPYLVIDNELQVALMTAAERGVKVCLVTPGIPDKKMVYRLTRSYYRDLMKAGVEIYEYLPGFVHAKSFVSDDHTAVVGTINMDYRSLFLHFECGVWMYRAAAVLDVKEDSEETMRKSHRVTMKDVRRGVIGALTDAVLRVLAPLM